MRSKDEREERGDEEKGWEEGRGKRKEDSEKGWRARKRILKKTDTQKQTKRVR